MSDFSTVTALGSSLKFASSRQIADPSAICPFEFLEVPFNFAISGEAANKVSEAVQGKHPEIPWGSMIGLCNILIQDYVKSKAQYLWGAVRKDLPVLLPQLEEVPKELQRNYCFLPAIRIPPSPVKMGSP